MANTDEPEWWEHAWGSKAERTAFFTGARERIERALREGKQATAPEVLLAGRMAKWKARNADGMRFPPQTEAEHRVWNDFGLHERGRNGTLDIGDIVAALSGVNDEMDEATGTAAEAQERLREAQAALKATKERAESAVSELKAKGGDSPPDAIAGAIGLLEGAVEAIDEDLEGYENAIDEIDEKVKARFQATKEAVEGYIDALMTGGA